MRLSTGLGMGGCVRARVCVRACVTRLLGDDRLKGDPDEGNAPPSPLPIRKHLSHLCLSLPPGVRPPSPTRLTHSLAGQLFVFLWGCWSGSREPLIIVHWASLPADLE